MRCYTVLCVLVVAFLFQLSPLDAASVRKRSLEAKCPYGEFYNEAAGFCEYCSLVCRDPRSQNCVEFCPTYASVQIANLEAKSREAGSANSSNSSSFNPETIVGFVIAGLVFVVFVAGFIYKFRKPVGQEEEVPEEAYTGFGADDLPLQNLASNSRQDTANSENFPLVTTPNHLTSTATAAYKYVVRVILCAF